MKSSMISAQDAFERMERRLNGPRDIVQEQLDLCEYQLNLHLTRASLGLDYKSFLRKNGRTLFHLVIYGLVQQGTINALEKAGYIVQTGRYSPFSVNRYCLAISLPDTFPSTRNCRESKILSAKEADKRLNYLLHEPVNLTRDQLEYCYVSFLNQLIMDASLSEPIEIWFGEDVTEEAIYTLEKLGWEVQIPFETIHPRHNVNLYFPTSLTKTSNKSTWQYSVLKCPRLTPGVLFIYIF